MKIYFHFSVHEPLFHQIAIKLRDDHGVGNIGGFVWGEDQADFLRGTGYPWSRLDVFTSWLADVKAPPDMDFLRDAEARYGFPNLARMVFAERNLLKRYRYEEILKIAEICVRRFVRLFDEDRPDALFVTSIDSLPVLLLHAIAKSRGVPSIHLDSGRIAGRVAVTHDPVMTWTDVDAAFAARKDLPLTGKSRAAAETFLDGFQHRRPRIQEPRRWMFPKPSMVDLQRLLGARKRFQRDPLNPVLMSTGDMLRQKATRLVNNRLAKWTNLFEAPVEGERYVLFPLHYQPEVSTLVMGTYYLDQPALIEDIAKSLPVGYRLYVKEHFFSIGRRPMEEFRRIRKCFNVRLIGPLEDPIKMVANAAAVATISGTMGWESVLMEKPTITFGDCFYNGYPQVYRAGLLPKIEWTRLFRQAVTEHRPDRELLLKYVAAILETTYEGYFSFDHAVLDSQLSMRDENFSNIAGVVAAELGLSKWHAGIPKQGAA